MNSSNHVSIYIYDSASGLYQRTLSGAIDTCVMCIMDNEDFTLSPLPCYDYNKNWRWVGHEWIAAE